MKKETLFFACLSLLALGGMLFSGARAQTSGLSSPVWTYDLQVAAEADIPTLTELTADNGWTLFQFNLTETHTRDTLTKAYLTTGANPVDIAKSTAVSLLPIGFDFPYGDTVMTHFGLTGNGLIYLGAKAADAGETAEVTRSMVYATSVKSLVEAIVVQPRCQNTTAATAHIEPAFVADAETKIAYYKGKHQEVDYLAIGIRNLWLEWKYGTTAKQARYSGDVLLWADGRIMARVVGEASALPTENQASLLRLAYRLFGRNGEQMIYAADWQGTANVMAANSSSVPVLTVSSDHLNTMLAFGKSAACTAPQGVAMELGIKYIYATDISAVLRQTAGDCDGWLALVADRALTAAEAPQDGKTYTHGSLPDSIGGFPLRIIGKDSVLKVSGLQSETTYYVYVFPYVERCSGARPVYAEPIVLNFKTIIGAPEVETAEVTGSSVTFRFPDLAADAKVLVGLSRRDYRQDADHCILEGISDKETAYAIGDTLFKDLSETADKSGNKGPYAITTVHNGTLTDGQLTVGGLEAGMPYYFYFWTATGETAYSQEYVEKGILTTPLVSPATPYTFTFAADRAPEVGETLLPAGWSRSAEGMDAEFKTGEFLLFGETVTDHDVSRALSAFLTGPGVHCADAITPVFRSTHAALGVRYQVRVQSTDMRSKLEQLTSSDTLTLWWREAGQEAWTLFEKVAGGETWEYDEAIGNFVTLKATAAGLPQNKDIQLRFMIKMQIGGKGGSHRFVLHHILVEPHLSCAYPENVAVFDSLTTHRVLGLNWEDENRPTASVVYRYREAGDETWSRPQMAQQPTACKIRFLKPETTYEVALQAVCREGDSSLVKVFEGTTLKALPYGQTLTDLTAWPDGMVIEEGALPEEGAAATKVPKSPCFKVDGYTADEHTYAGTNFNISKNSEGWLKLPVLGMETDAAPAEFTFQYKALYKGAEGPEAVDAESPFRVLVLVSEDGSFSRTDSVAELTVKDMTLDFQTCTVDMSKYAGRVQIALYVENTDVSTANKTRRTNTYFLIDQLSVRYMADRPCYPVESIEQYDLTTSGITISWLGQSLEYGIILTDEDEDVTDTVYTAETTYTFTDLKPGTLYTYHIQGYCEAEHRSPGELSEEGFFTTRSVCGLPTDFNVVGVSDTSVQISAKASGERLVHLWSQVGGYEVEKAWTGSDATMEILGLTPETAYAVAVRNVCAAGDSSAWTQPLAFTTKAAQEPEKPVCGAPTALVCDSVGETYAALKWTAGENNVSYILSYSPAASASDLTEVAVSETAYRMEGLQPNTAYAWRMNGVCAADTSALAEGPAFTTKEKVGVDPTSRFQGLKVGSSHGRIAIYNVDALAIDRVEVYGLNGRKLYGADFGGTTDHLLLPALDEGSHLVLVRIFSAGETAVYKIVLL